MDELLSILDLEQLEHNLYRGRSPKLDWQRVFGGQTIAQALVAAQRTVEPERHVHSLHGYFMRPGDTKVPIVYEVDRIRDGGSFTTRRVVAIQHGQAIFSLEASFQQDEVGLEHQLPMPRDVPPPDSLLSQRELLGKFGEAVPDGIKRYWERDRPIEMKPVMLEHYTSREKLEPQQNIWIRTTGPVPADRGIQAAVLAYLSDMTLLDTSTLRTAAPFSTATSRRRASTMRCGSIAAIRSMTGSYTRRTAPRRRGRAASPAARCLPATAR
ncbi:acyl-CoA thioesterase [Mesorhizobium sp. LSHC440A00]|nr:acyl-CoA thioesterase [Mesorhizobium sp. LSHC440A00]